MHQASIRQIKPTTSVTVRKIVAISLCCYLTAIIGCQNNPSLQDKKSAEPELTFANVQPENISYTGDDTCASCHAEEYAGFQEHGMAASYYRVDDTERNETFDIEALYHPETDFYYRPVKTDSGYYQEEYRLDTNGKRTHVLRRRMDHVIGSGGAAQTYITDDNGWLYELPLTWYTQTNRWDFSPGYDVSNIRFSRVIPDRCMACHNAYPEDIPKLEGKFAAVPNGISCERCHGPGRLHVDERLSDPDASPAIDTTIVNPVHLPLARRLDVCQQCHLNGSIDVLRKGRSAFDFQPSQALSEHRALFISKDLSDQGIKVISHADRMQLSECYIQTLQSSRPLECVTCHDPHAGFRDEGPDYFNITCKSCHDLRQVSQRISVEFTEAHREASNCISCHMPREDVRDVPHSSFTDHFIRVVGESEEATSGVRPISSREVTMAPIFSKDSDSAEGAVYRGIALITYGRQQADTTSIASGIDAIVRNIEKVETFPEAEFMVGLGHLYLGDVSSALPWLESVVRLDPDDPEQLNALAQAYETDDREKSVIQRLYVRGLSIQPLYVDMRLNYGRYLLSVGEVDKAIDEFTRASREQPHNATALFNLGTAHLQIGEVGEAETYLHKSLRLDPDNVEALGNLGFLHAGAERQDSAEVYFLRAVAVGESDAVALGNLGAFYLNTGSHDAAIEVLLRAVTSDPGFVDALANLSLAYFQVDDMDNSRRYAEQAIRERPDHPLARQILEAI